MTYFISNESEVSRYPQNMHYHFFHSSVKTGMWSTAQGVDLFYAYTIAQNAKGCVVISLGRAEAIIKYAELIYELQQNGYSVFIFDHQGQGNSSRLAPNRHIGYVSSFDDYVDDMDVLIQKVLQPILDKENQSDIPKYLLAHSMGSAIATLFLLKHPTVFTKAVLSAPMFGIKAPLHESAVNILVSTILAIRKAFNLPERYFLGQTDYQAYPFSKNRLTSCETRYRVFREVLASEPQAQLGGISFTWLAQAIKAMRTIRQHSSAILLPCLIFQAKQDKIVDNKRITEIANTIPTAKLIEVDDAEHEILFEKDEIRHKVMTDILTFFDDEMPLKR